MPDLTSTIRWVEYAPDLLGNKEADQPFYFLFHGSMSKAQINTLAAAMALPVSVPDLPDGATAEQRTDHEAAVSQAIIERDSAALEPYVKLGREPLFVDGARIETLRGYFEFVMGPRLASASAYEEVRRALLLANMMDYRVSFSSGRLSGGSTSTGSPRNGKAGSQTAAR